MLQSEYVSARDKRRAFVSGFTGSAGLFILPINAHLVCAFLNRTDNRMLCFNSWLLGQVMSKVRGNNGMLKLDHTFETET